MVWWLWEWTLWLLGMLGSGVGTRLYVLEAVAFVGRYWEARRSFGSVTCIFLEAKVFGSRRFGSYVLEVWCCAPAKSRPAAPWQVDDLGHRKEPSGPPGFGAVA